MLWSSPLQILNPTILQSSLVRCGSRNISMSTQIIFFVNWVFVKKSLRSWSAPCTTSALWILNTFPWRNSWPFFYAYLWQGLPFATLASDSNVQMTQPPNTSTKCSLSFHQVHFIQLCQPSRCQYPPPLVKNTWQSQDVAIFTTCSQVHRWQSHPMCNTNNQTHYVPQPQRLSLPELPFCMFIQFKVCFQVHWVGRVSNG